MLCPCPCIYLFAARTFIPLFVSDFIVLYLGVRCIRRGLDSASVDGHEEGVVRQHHPGPRGDTAGENFIYV